MCCTIDQELEQVNSPEAHEELKVFSDAYGGPSDEDYAACEAELVMRDDPTKYSKSYLDSEFHGNPVAEKAYREGFRESAVASLAVFQDPDSDIFDILIGLYDLEAKADSDRSAARQSASIGKHYGVFAKGHEVEAARTRGVRHGLVDAVHLAESCEPEKIAFDAADPEADRHNSDALGATNRLREKLPAFSDWAELIRCWADDASFTNYEYADFKPVLDLPRIAIKQTSDLGISMPTEPRRKTPSACSMFNIDEESLWNPGGLIQEIMNHNLRTAYKPQPELAMAGSVSLVSGITGQKVQAGKTGIRPNVMFVGIAGSGAGKEHARQVNKILLSRAGAAKMLADSLASDVGLLKQMSRSPSSVIQLDELGRVLATCENANKNPHLYKIKTMIMQLYSSSGTVFLGANHGDDKKDVVVYNPNCVIYGTTTPSTYFAALTTDTLKDGSLNRWLPIEVTNNDPDPNDDAENIEDIPDSLLNQIKWWVDQNSGATELPGPARRLTYDEATKAEYKKLETAARKKINLEADRGTAIWTRCHEYAQKLGLLHQLSLEREATAVSVGSARWGCALALRCTERMEEMVEANVADGEFDAIGKKLRNFIKLSKNGRARSEISRHVRNLPPRDLTEALRKLVETGDIAFEMKPSAKGPATEHYQSIA